MGIDIVDGFGCQSRVSQGRAHGRDRATLVGRWIRDAVGVQAGAVAQNLG